MPRRQRNTNPIDAAIGCVAIVGVAVTGCAARGEARPSTAGARTRPSLIQTSEPAMPPGPIHDASPPDPAVDGAPAAPGRPRIVIVDTPDCVILSPVAFARGSDALGPESAKILEEVARAMLKDPGLRLEVEGHADRSEGNGAAKLAAMRAQRVRDALLNLHISTDRLAVKSFAATRPRDTSRTDGARTRNRRVEFRVKKRVGEKE